MSFPMDEYLKLWEERYAKGPNLVLQSKYEINEIKNSWSIMLLGLGNHDSEIINDKFTELSRQLKEKEITSEEFYEEFDALKMAMKLVEE